MITNTLYVLSKMVLSLCHQQPIKIINMQSKKVSQDNMATILLEQIMMLSRKPTNKKRE
jgi:hypothetical protein